MYVCASQLVRVSVEYLVGSNESVHSQVVLHHFLCHVWWVGQHSALEQSGWASLTRLARRAGGLDVTEECVPGLEHIEKTDPAEASRSIKTWTKSIPAAHWLMHIVSRVWLNCISRPTLAAAVNCWLLNPVCFQVCWTPSANFHSWGEKKIYMQYYYFFNVIH